MIPDTTLLVISRKKAESLGAVIGHFSRFSELLRPRIKDFVEVDLFKRLHELDIVLQFNSVLCEQILLIENFVVALTHK